VSIIAAVILAIATGFGISSLVISLQLIENAPAPTPQTICPVPNLTLDGAAVGLYNVTELATVTTALTCAANQTRLGLHRLSTGLTLGGQCVDIPSGIIMLPAINPANVSCGPPNVNVLSIAQLTREGLGFNGSCLAILVNTSSFTGGDTTGTKSNLLLANVGGGASTCGGGLQCRVTNDAKGRVTALVNGPAVLLANATVNGGATGPLGNMSLSMIGTANQFVVTNYANGTVQLGLVQPMCPTCSPSFSAATLTLLPLGTTSGGSGLASTPINGQMWIGTGTGFALATITGTANRIIVTPGAGSLGLSAPQDLATGSSPTFLSLTLTTPLSTLNGGTGIGSAPTNGQVLIGNGGNAFTLTTITGTTDQVNVVLGAGSITLSTPQNLATTSSVTFAGIASFGLPLVRASGGTGQTGVYNNGQTLIGQAGGTYTRNTFTQGTGMTVTNGAGSITLSVGQDIGTGSAVSFVTITLSAALALASGGTGITTLPTAGRLLIGNGAGYTLALLTTVSAQITITSSAGAINLGLPSLTTAAIVGSSFNYGVLVFDVKGRITNRRNDTAYANTEPALSVTGCITTAPSTGMKLSKVILNAALGAIVASMQSSATTATNSAGCSVTIGAIPAAYRPVGFFLNVASTIRRNTTHSLVSSWVIDGGSGNSFLNPYTKDGNSLYTATAGYPVNIGTAFSIQQVTASFLTLVP
jgi:hypothetical protein